MPEPIRATLLFLVDEASDLVLLIRKKRGIGAGKINAPGGKIDPGETPAECAVRETREEVGVVSASPTRMGELHFEFTDGLVIDCTVFVSSEFDGEAIETEEAKPHWTRIDEIPYDEMWADDLLWLPRMLAGETFRGEFTFDGDALLGHRLEFGVL